MKMIHYITGEDAMPRYDYHCTVHAEGSSVEQFETTRKATSSESAALRAMEEFYEFFPNGPKCLRIYVKKLGGRSRGSFEYASSQLTAEAE